MSAYRFTTLCRPCRAPDGDTIYCDQIDRGEGTIEMAPSDDPFSLRLVGPMGEWFDAAEKRGRKARPEGKVAARIMDEALRPVIDGGLWLACQTFKRPRSRHLRRLKVKDTFGRYLYFPYAVVDPSKGWEQSKFDIIGTLVAAGVARLGGRFGEGEDR